jgi:hypothetical protein
MPTRESYQREAWSHNVGLPPRDGGFRGAGVDLLPRDSDVREDLEDFLKVRPDAAFFLKINSC